MRKSGLQPVTFQIRLCFKVANLIVNIGRLFGECSVVKLFKYMIIKHILRMTQEPNFEVWREVSRGLSVPYFDSVEFIIS
jgi:hypothetical protein